MRGGIHWKGLSRGFTYLAPALIIALTDYKIVCREKEVSRRMAKRSLQLFRWEMYPKPERIWQRTRRNGENLKMKMREGLGKISVKWRSKTGWKLGFFCGCRCAQVTALSSALDALIPNRSYDTTPEEGLRNLEPIEIRFLTGALYTILVQLQKIKVILWMEIYIWYVYVFVACV